jgi:hypothetical protein
MSFAHQSFPPGVTDHGLLTGLADDDHSQYALANKTRPTTWVQASDLAARSLADLGTKAHDLLTGLTDDDHTQYARLLGRSGGQLLAGGVDAQDWLVLQSTVDATRGGIEIKDKVMLTHGGVYDSGDALRLQIDTSSPHVTISDDLKVEGQAEFGASPYGFYGALVNAGGSSPGSPAIGIYDLITGTASSGTQLTTGLFGGASGQGSPTIASVVGLYFYAQHNSAGLAAVLTAIYAQLISGSSGSGAITTARGVHLPTATWTGSKPTTVAGVDVEEQGGAGTGTAYGQRIADQTATTVRLLELGPATPYLRLVGGANPAANQTNLYLKEQATLRRVQWKDGAAVGAGDKVMVLV